jgi:hypothetical protein
MKRSQNAFARGLRGGVLRISMPVVAPFAVHSIDAWKLMPKDLKFGYHSVEF